MTRAVARSSQTLLNSLSSFGTRTRANPALSPTCIQRIHYSQSQQSDQPSRLQDQPVKDIDCENLDGTNKTSQKMTVAEADEALRMSMRNIDGGGESSVEMEGGKFVGLRRGVKDNMFRLI